MPASADHDIPSAEEQLVAEGRLARQLLAAPARARAGLYGRVYDEVYRMHLARHPEVLDFGADRSLLPFLLERTREGELVVELGCGTGLLAVELARAGRRVVGCDVSARALALAKQRAAGVSGVDFKLLDGLQLPFTTHGVDFAYSVEVLEHIHEEDAQVHLAEIARILRPGGECWIHTPHRNYHRNAADRFGIAGETPPDGDVHLKEWTYTELAAELCRSGFVEARLVWWFWLKRLRRVPVVSLQPIRWLERLPPRMLPRSPRWSLLAGIAQCSILARRPGPRA